MAQSFSPSKPIALDKAERSLRRALEAEMKIKAAEAVIDILVHMSGWLPEATLIRAVHFMRHGFDVTVPSGHEHLRLVTEEYLAGLVDRIERKIRDAPQGDGPC